MNPNLENSRKLLSPFKELKGGFPFRLGTTSYIYPGEILPNLELLGGVLDEVQLLLFEGNSYSNIPDRRLIRELNDCIRNTNLSLTIHLPLDAYPGHEDEVVRKHSVEMIRRIYDAGLALNCSRFVFHYAMKSLHEKTYAGRERWRAQLQKSTEELIASGVRPESLCVENLDYPYGWIADLIHAYGLAKCIDLGHLRVNRFPVKSHLRKHLPETHVIHLHGLKNGRDHHGLSSHDSKTIRMLLSEIERTHFSETLILEVFRLDHLIESLKTWMKEWMLWNRRSF